MDLLELDEVRLEGGGVMFQYLLCELVNGDEKKVILRGLNYAPYAGDVTESVKERARRELEEGGFFSADGDLRVVGGGSLCLNPYYETITLFGSNPTHGNEADRETAAQLLQRAFPDHEVDWFSAESKSSKKSPPEEPSSVAG